MPAVRRRARRRIMRRLAGIALAVVFVLALAIAATPIVISADTLEHATVDALEDLTGRRVAVTGDSTIFPNLRLTVEGVSVAGSDPTGPPLLTAESLSATFRLLPLAIGRLELSEVHFRKPVLHLARDAAGNENWRGTGLIDRIFAAPDEAHVRSPVGRVTMEAGLVTFTDAGTERLRLSDMVGLIDWPQLDRRVRLSGSLRWRSEVVDFDLQAEEPLELLGGGASDLDLDMTSRYLRAKFAGSGVLAGSVQLEGEASATTSSLARLMAALGQRHGPEIGPVSLSGAIDWDNDQFALADASVEVGGDAGQGALTVALGPAPRLWGTLAFDTVRLGPANSGTNDNGANGSADADAVTQGAAGLAPLLDGAIGTDLRLSATTVSYGPLEIGPVAATLATGADGVALSIGEAMLGDGSLQGEIHVARGDGGRGITVAGNISAARLDLARTLARLELPPLATGIATATFNGSTTATTAEGLFAAVTGHVETTVAGGSLRDVDLWRLGTGGGVLAPGAATPFDTLSLSADVAPARIEVGRAHLERSGETIEGTIALDRNAGTLDGTVRLTSGNPPETSAFEVSGPLASPVVAPAATQ